MFYGYLQNCILCIVYLIIWNHLQNIMKNPLCSYIWLYLVKFHSFSTCRTPRPSYRTFVISTVWLCGCVSRWSADTTAHGRHCPSALSIIPGLLSCPWGVMDCRMGTFIPFTSSQSPEYVWSLNKHKRNSGGKERMKTVTLGFLLCGLETVEASSRTWGGGDGGKWWRLERRMWTGWSFLQPNSRTASLMSLSLWSICE